MPKQTQQPSPSAISPSLIGSIDSAIARYDRERETYKDQGSYNAGWCSGAIEALCHVKEMLNHAQN